MKSDIFSYAKIQVDKNLYVGVFFLLQGDAAVLILAYDTEFMVESYFAMQHFFGAEDSVMHLQAIQELDLPYKTEHMGLCLTGANACNLFPMLNVVMNALQQSPVSTNKLLTSTIKPPFLRTVVLPSALVVLYIRAGQDLIVKVFWSLDQINESDVAEILTKDLGTKRWFLHKAKEMKLPKSSDTAAIGATGGIARLVFGAIEIFSENKSDIFEVTKLDHYPTVEESEGDRNTGT